MWRSIPFLLAGLLSGAALASGPTVVSLEPSLTLTDATAFPGVEQYFSISPAALPLAVTSAAGVPSGGASAADALLDGRLDTYLTLNTVGAAAGLVWAAPIYNNAGADLAIFDLGNASWVGVTLADGTDIKLQAAFTGYKMGAKANSPKVNLALLDLSDLNVADGSFITGLTIHTGTVGNGRNTSASPLELAGVFPTQSALTVPVTAVPEPDTFMLMGLGLGLVALAARRKRVR